MLEHELTVQSAQAFIDNYPLIGQNGWNIVSAAQMNEPPYDDDGGGAQDAIGPVTSAGTLQDDVTPTLPSSSASQSTTSCESTSTVGPSWSSDFNGVSRTTASAVLALRVTLFASVAGWLF